MKNEIAILVAAGKGERMRPITANQPKPLVKVHGVPMIETMIEGLRHRGVQHIYITTGYLGEQFGYLLEKYDNITLIPNPDYVIKNNISSLYAAREVLGNGEKDCFVCEADICVSDFGIFDAELEKSGYFGKFVAGASDDWVFDRDENGRITRVGKYGCDKYNMCGVCFLKAADAKVIADAIVETCSHPGEYEQMYWDEIVDRQLSNIDMTVYPVADEQIVEIDTVAELIAVDSSYESYNS